jgi:hypothetical protein
MKNVNKFSALVGDEEAEEASTRTDIPTVVRKTPVLKGAWGKGVSAAVKEEKTFEKQPAVEKKDPFSTMTSLDVGTNLNAIVEGVQKTREILLTPSNIDGWDWGDRVESDSESEDDYSDYGY